MTLQEVYQHRVGVGSAGRVDAARAQAIVIEAMPHAAATLGLPTGAVLAVSPNLVAPDVARGGSLIPAWPVRQADGSVVIEHVEDWGALLAGFLAAAGAERSESVDLAQRVWIGIANDVLQLFVVDPPPSTYSMVRHHALMLAAATAWLGAPAVRAWQATHMAAGAAFIRSRHGHLNEAIEAAESSLDTLLADERAHQPAARALAWLDNDSAARERYLAYLGAASLGVAAVLHVMLGSALDPAAWLRHAVKDLHPDPEFNRVWMEECAFA